MKAKVFSRVNFSRSLPQRDDNWLWFDWHAIDVGQILIIIVCLSNNADILTANYRWKFTRESLASCARNTNITRNYFQIIFALQSLAKGSGFLNLRVLALTRLIDGNTRASGLLKRRNRLNPDRSPALERVSCNYYEASTEQWRRKLQPRNTDETTYPITTNATRRDALHTASSLIHLEKRRVGSRGRGKGTRVK